MSVARSSDEMAFRNLRTMARHILEEAPAFKWSLQGLGMLRLHMGNNTRLHVWDLRHAFPGASAIHDHLQWGLHSTVLSGCIENQRYSEDPSGEPFVYQTFKAGYGCFTKHEPRPIRLICSSGEVYLPGESYSQRPEEIHRTVPVNGTVTIMHKTPSADPDSARIFWPAGTEWGSAEPRAATISEVWQITQYALKQWALLPGEVE
jgi:hypothetical protein